MRLRDLTLGWLMGILGREAELKEKRKNKFLPVKKNVKEKSAADASNVN